MRTYSEFIAKTFAGLEPVLSKELEELGATHIKLLKRAVRFKGDLQTLYLANLKCHTALKILMPIHSFKAKNGDDLYKGIQKITWSAYLDLDQTFSVDAAVFSEHFSHSGFVALKAKDAIVDQFRKIFNQRPYVHKHDPEIKIHIHIARDLVSVSLDSSLDPLFKRGYRTDSHRAPLNEVLAAGILKLIGWQPSIPLVDFMCGSGTFLLEAKLLANANGPHLLREDFGFKQWTNFDKKCYDSIKNHPPKKTKQLVLKGSDKNIRAIHTSRESARVLGIEKGISFEVMDFRSVRKPEDRGVVLVNPPYDFRMNDKDIITFYKTIGDHLKTHFSGWDAWVLSGNIDALKHIGLKASKKIKLFNGQLPVELRKYELYVGSKKDK